MTQETAAQNINNQHKFRIENEKIEMLNWDPMHGQFHRDLERQSVDKEKFLVLLCSSGLKGETEDLIIVAQSQHSILVIIRRTS